MPGAGAAAEDRALLGVPGEDRLHRVVDAEDEAGRALRVLLEADVEPHGGVEGGLLVEQDVGQLGLEGVGVGGRREVVALAAPAGDRAGDAADHLLDGALALGRAERPAEVLLGDDVGRVLRPGDGELDLALLEGGGGGVADDGVALLPDDLVEGVDSLRGEPPIDLQTAVGDLRGRVDRRLRNCLRHLSSPS